MRLLKRLNRSPKSQLSMICPGSQPNKIKRLQNLRIPINNRRLLNIVDERCFLENFESYTQNRRMSNINNNRVNKGCKRERLTKVRETLLKMMREEFPKHPIIPSIRGLKALKPDFALSAGQFSSISVLNTDGSQSIFVYGGIGAKIADALIEVETSKAKFQELSLADGGYPMGRFGHSMHRIGPKHLLIYGGQISRLESDKLLNQQQLYNQIGCIVFDREKLTLRSVDENIFQAPRPRKYHASCVIGKSFLLVFGGVHFDTGFGKVKGKYHFMSDLWVLDIQRGRWFSFPFAERTQRFFGKGVAYHSMVTTWNYTVQPVQCLRGGSLFLKKGKKKEK